MTGRAQRWFAPTLAAAVAACAPAQPRGATVAPTPAAAAAASTTAPAPPRQLSSRAPGATASAAAVGTPHPFALEAAAPDGSWVVLCQAREDSDRDGHVRVRLGPQGQLLGDRLRSFLVMGSGAGELIDELAAVGPTGRWLAIRRSGHLVLLDTTSKTELDLTARGADDRHDALSYHPHRALSFDARGNLLLYLQRRDGSSRVVVRELAGGKETSIDPGTGAVWRAQLSPAGEWVVLRMLVDDTNGNGRLDWPVPPAARNSWRCGGPIPKMNAWAERGDRVVTKVVSSSGGRARVVAGFVAPYADALLERPLGGGLLLRPRQGRAQRLAPPDCDARVVHADTTRGLLIAACAGPSGGRSLAMLLGPGYRKDLKLTLAPQSHDRWPAGSPRLVPLYPGQATVLVDMNRRVSVALKPGDSVIATSGPRALIRRGQSLWIHNVEQDRERPLPGRTNRLPLVVRTASIAVVSPLVVNLGTGRVLGQVSRRPWAVSRNGRVLVAAGREADAERLAVGPLSWVAPR